MKEYVVMESAASDLFQAKTTCYNKWSKKSVFMSESVCIHKIGVANTLGLKQSQKKLIFSKVPPYPALSNDCKEHP